MRKINKTTLVAKADTKKHKTNHSSIEKQKELVKKMRDLNVKMKTNVLERVTNDFELSEQLSKTYNNMLGKTVDERAEVSQLLDDYNKAPANLKEYYLKRLPPNLQLEIMKSNILSVPIAQEINKLNPPVALQQLETEIKRLSTAITNNNSVGAIQTMRTEILQKINELDAKFGTLPNSTDFQNELAQLKAEFNKLGTNPISSPSTDPASSPPSTGVPGIQAILSTASAHNDQRRANVSFDRDGMDPIKQTKPILSINVIGNKFYMIQEEVANGTINIYNYSDKYDPPRAIVTKKSTPGLVRLLVNDNVKPSEVQVEDIADFNLIFDAMTHRINTRGANTQKMKDFRVPYWNITQEGSDSAPELVTLIATYYKLRNDIDNGNPIPKKLLQDFFVAVNKKIDYIKLNRTNPEFNASEIQQRIDSVDNKLRAYRRDMIAKLEKRIIEHVNKGGARKDIHWVDIYDNELNTRGAGIETKRKEKTSGNGIKIFTSRQEVEDRLKLLEGSKQAGNNSKEVQSEINSIKKILRNASK